MQGLLFGLGCPNLRRYQVRLHQGNHQYGEQEDGELERLPQTWQSDLRNVDHDDSQGLTDVFLQGVQCLEEVHRADGLHGEGKRHQARHAIPMCEEPFLLDLRLHAAHQQRGHRPSGCKAGNLGVERHIRKGLQVLLREHRAIARNRHLEHYAHHPHRWQGTSAATAVGTLVHQNEATHCQKHGKEHMPLQAALPGSLEPPQHQGSDQQLCLQQHLVDAPAKLRHGLHLKEVTQRIDGADEPEDRHAPGLPA
mmetsp:Transcript_17619/g.46922  ORF Transcript_17619/g.46922 Transcript_17619/m.46922 type:complete len:252 (+) Transcript_17619:639-1394(+)